MALKWLSMGLVGNRDEDSAQDNEDDGSTIESSTVNYDLLTDIDPSRLDFQGKRVYYELKRMQESGGGPREYWSSKRSSFNSVPYPLHKLTKQVTEEEYQKDMRVMMAKALGMHNKKDEEEEDYDIDKKDDETEVEDTYKFHSLIASTFTAPVVDEKDTKYIAKAFDKSMSFRVGKNTGKATKNVIGTYEYVKEVSRVFIRDKDQSLVPLPVDPPPGVDPSTYGTFLHSHFNINSLALRKKREILTMDDIRKHGEVKVHNSNQHHHFSHHFRDAAHIISNAIRATKSSRRLSLDRSLSTSFSKSLRLSHKNTPSLTQLFHRDKDDQITESNDSHTQYSIDLYSFVPNFILLQKLTPLKQLTVSVILTNMDSLRLKLAIIIDKDTDGQLNCTFVMAGFRAMSQAEESNSEDLLLGDVVTSIGSIDLSRPVPMLANNDDIDEENPKNRSYSNERPTSRSKPSSRRSKRSDKNAIVASSMGQGIITDRDRARVTAYIMYIQEAVNSEILSITRRFRKQEKKRLKLKLNNCDNTATMLLTGRSRTSSRGTNRDPFPLLLPPLTQSMTTPQNTGRIHSSRSNNSVPSTPKVEQETLSELVNTTSERIFENESIIEEEALLKFSLKRYDLREWVAGNTDGNTDGHDGHASPMVHTRYFDIVLL